MTNIIINNRKKIITILVFIELISLFLSYKSFSSKGILQDDVVKTENTIHRNMFSMYTENEDGKYTLYTDSNLFPSGYNLNAEKSICVDNNDQLVENVLSSKNNMVTVTSNKTVFCYLYFDLPEPSVTLTISTDGTSNTLPTYNHYKQDLTCDNGTTSLFNIKNQRIEISNVNNTNTNCNLNYINDTNSYTLLKAKVQEKGTAITSSTYDDDIVTSYRYTGKQPDNWVWFNNELWRIIGSVPTTLSDGVTIDNKVKIIRATPIGGINYDVSSSDMVWGNNTLYTLLNEYYYGKKDATYDGTDETANTPCVTDTGRYGLCNYKNIGISSNSNDYYGRMVIDTYMYVGNVTDNKVSISETYKSETSVLTTNLVKIGLMNASDYGYATSDIDYETITLSNTSDTTASNWLYGGGEELTMTPTGENNVFCVSKGGYVASFSSEENLVRPVVYLHSDVYVISGSGTEIDPYILGM